MSKGEKKARKALEKVGLVEVHDVIEFSLKRMGTKFVIHDPAVYKLPSSEHYVIYGEPKNEFMDAKTRQLLEQLQANMKEQQANNEERRKKNQPLKLRHQLLLKLLKIMDMFQLKKMLKFLWHKLIPHTKKHTLLLRKLKVILLLPSLNSNNRNF
ncbi:nascent polypeptide associated complex alpha subunit, putative [Entamoeba dispar SAW760]|uniref:Nascent polypeptide associated complex alpha subunit, putative n=1 Tax=Entamoeba dispar (strain ATCC PRA-260 / SAW760) TaxID=370354 RepID=B0EE42_ENTDS|nr:nascent polypeptide associated complex alpha subunit, putative [Entamoeba dispar SAW760]EDR27200.1 nascent polypeptide associated complex alpha subunit, putative [Entamoeba dispar SAW760]|eukprot:EDR27200.1 nascent polypeptide associated complex alpha subunit, putative [Entamoeba dispar SAW760]